MHENDKSSFLNTNKIDFLSGKSPNKEKVSLDSIKSEYIRSEISSYLEGSKSLKILGHNKKRLKEFSESEYFFQDKYYVEFLNDILIDPDTNSIFYMCSYIFEKDIEALEKELKDVEKQKFHFDSEEGEISERFKLCLFVLALPNILHDIFSITLSDFRKLTKEDLAKRPEDLKQLLYCYQPDCFEPFIIDSYDSAIKSGMIYAYNVLKKKSENKNNERLDYLKSIVLETEKVEIKNFSTDNLPIDDTEKKFRSINCQKLIYITMVNVNDRVYLSDSWREFECDEYFTFENASLVSIEDKYCYQYYTMLKDNPEYFYSFSSLEEFDIAWNKARDYISTELKNRYYKYLFIIADGNQNKFVQFLEKKAEEQRDPNMLYRCTWRPAILRVTFLVLLVIILGVSFLFLFLCILAIISLYETVLWVVLAMIAYCFPTLSSIFILCVKTREYYNKSYEPFFAKHTPFEYKYNRYLQNKYPILKPENRDEHFFDESKEFQEYKKRITNEKKRFEFIATKYQARDGSNVEKPKISPSLDGII